MNTLKMTFRNARELIEHEDDFTNDEADRYRTTLIEAICSEAMTPKDYCDAVDAIAAHVGECCNGHDGPTATVLCWSSVTNHRDTLAALDAAMATA